MAPTILAKYGTAKGTQNILRQSVCNNHEAVDIEMGLNFNTEGKYDGFYKGNKTGFFWRRDEKNCNVWPNYT